MNEIQQLKRKILETAPLTQTRLEHPRNANGQWWLDVKLGDRTVIVQWSRRLGFGVSANPGGIGEGPEEVFSTVDATSDYIIQRLVELPVELKRLGLDLNYTEERKTEDGS